MAWALDYPGVFTYGADRAEALLRMPRELLRYENWLNLHTDQSWVALEGMDLHIDETCEMSPPVRGSEYHEVSALFLADLTALNQEDIQRALLIHSWQREELMAGIDTLPPELLTRPLEAQQTITDILKHIAEVEFEYFSYLGFEPERPAETADYFQLLIAGERLVHESLPDLQANAMVIEREQERWSARKLVRRLLWHQRLHLDQIRTLVLG